MLTELVLLQACGGAQDGAVRLWRSRSGNGASKFDLAMPSKLRGHTGPVVSLASDERYDVRQICSPGQAGRKGFWFYDIALQ